MRKSLLSALLFSATFSSAAVVVQEVASTPTQAILRYVAPSASACTLEVSTSSTYAPVVYDLNTTLFTGSNADTRTGSVTNGTYRNFVVGQRTASVASDGKKYSRALETNRLYYYRVTCGADTATGTFNTKAPPLGGTNSDTLPFASSGTYAWPSQDWTSENSEVIDPLTGVVIRRASQPQEVTANLTDQSFSTVPVTTGWSLQNNVLADDSSAAVFSGAGSNKLYVRISTFVLTDGGIAATSLDYLMVKLKASGAAASGSDRTISVCWTIDGSTCLSGTLTQALTTSTATYTIGTSSLTLLAWGSTPFAGREDVIQRTGSADYTSATKTVTRLSGTYFDLRWSSGTKITYDGTEYSISSVTDVDHLVLVTGPGSDQSAKTYTADTFGILIWKTSASTDNIVIQWVGYDLGASHQAYWPAGGFYELCNKNPVTISGEVGYYCYMYDLSGISNMYWFGNEGSRRFLGRMWIPYGGASEMEATQACALQPDTNDANVAWCIGSNNVSKYVLIKVTYDGSNTDEGSLTYYQTGSHFSYTNVTPSTGNHDLQYIANVFNSSYPVAGMFSCNKVMAVQNGNLLIWCLADGQQDRMGWAMVFSPGNGQALGSGGTGAVIAMTDFHTSTSTRWCQPHSLDVIGDTDAMQMTSNSFTGSSFNGHGPYQTTLNGNVDASTTTFNVNKEPCDPSPGTAETNIANANCQNASHHYVQNAAVGDVFLVDSEYVRITAKSGYTWTVERAFLGTASYTNSAASHSSGTVVTAQCTGRGTAIWWKYVADPTGTAKEVNPYDSGSHRVYRPNKMIYVGNGWIYSGLSYNSQEFYVEMAGAPTDFFTSTRSYVAISPAFAGKTATQSGNLIQTHPSLLPNVEWFSDARPLIGGTDSKFDGTFVSTGGQLWHYASGSILDRKHMPTLVESGGYLFDDISSSATGNVISTTSADSWKYCYAENNNECRAGSVAGALYVNAPSITTGACYINGINSYDGNGNFVRDLCVGNNPPYSQSVSQMSTNHDVFGRFGRVLTYGLSKYKRSYTYWNTRFLPDSTWAFFLSPNVDGSREEILRAKVPSRRIDSVNRGTFIPVPVSAGSAPTGANRMLVKFGYDTNFYCTTRREACYATATSITESAPFTFAGSLANGDGDQSGSGYAVAIPAISGKVLYYQVVWRASADGSVIETGPVNVAGVP